MIINQVIEKACDMSVNSMSLENYNYVEDIKPVWIKLIKCIIQIKQ
jgi:hypothetical protein